MVMMPEQGAGKETGLFGNIMKAISKNWNNFGS
jgi:hypothetical protein